MVWTFTFAGDLVLILDGHIDSDDLAEIGDHCDAGDLGVGDHPADCRSGGVFSCDECRGGTRGAV